MTDTDGLALLAPMPSSAGSNMFFKLHKDEDSWATGPPAWDAGILASWSSPNAKRKSPAPPLFPGVTDGCLLPFALAPACPPPQASCFDFLLLLKSHHLRVEGDPPEPISLQPHPPQQQAGLVLREASEHPASISSGHFHV